MQLPDFQAAQLPAPRSRGSDPSWLAGIGRGRPAYILGGAGGLVESPGLSAARGQIVIGTNWTLRALVPSLWHVVDPDVWKSERGHLTRCPESMGCVVSHKIYGGGGIYSTAQSRQTRMIGRSERHLSVIRIAKATRGVRDPRGHFRYDIVPPYLPKRLTDEFHPGGNSVCFTIQLAHLMGCAPVYLLGFTLQSGSGYHYGLTNPVTRRRSFYDTVRPLHWLRWYQQQFPGRVLLYPGWSGPIYEVFDEVKIDSGSQPESGGGDGAGIQRLRSDRGDQSVHPDGEQSGEAGAMRS